MVAFSDFFSEVKREIAYQAEGGTSWRRQVSSMAEYIVIQSPVRSVDYFCNKNDVVALVKDLIPLDDDELVEDIGEFLSHIARDMIFKSNLPNEVSEYVEMQKEKRKGKQLRLKKQESEKEDSSNEGLKFVFENYSKTLEGLKDK